MKITKQARRGAKDLFRSCLVNGLLDEKRVRAAVTMVIEKKPRAYVPILSHFKRLVTLEVGRRTATVESALPLDTTLQATVASGLTRLYGAGLSLSFTHNPALIGGLRIKVGSDVLDGSIQARLEALKQSV